jgi:hypothetical protein
MKPRWNQNFPDNWSKNLSLTTAYKVWTEYLPEEPNCHIIASSSSLKLILLAICITSSQSPIVLLSTVLLKANLKWMPFQASLTEHPCSLIIVYISQY